MAYCTRLCVFWSADFKVGDFTETGSGQAQGILNSCDGFLCVCAYAYGQGRNSCGSRASRSSDRSRRCAAAAGERDSERRGGLGRGGLGGLAAWPTGPQATISIQISSGFESESLDLMKCAKLPRFVWLSPPRDCWCCRVARSCSAARIGIGASPSPPGSDTS